MKRKGKKKAKTQLKLVTSVFELGSYLVILINIPITTHVLVFVVTKMCLCVV